MNQPSAVEEFSRFGDEPPFRLQRALGLAPAQGEGSARRALLLSLLAWLPIVVWAVVTGRAMAGPAAEPLLRHFGIHTRLLVALPMLVAGEAYAHRRIAGIVSQMRSSGIVPQVETERFDGILSDCVRKRRGLLPWLVMAVVAETCAWATVRYGDTHELVWAAADGAVVENGLGFGGWWYMVVARPLFAFFLLGWIWRVGMTLLLLRRLLRLDLSIVPTHPDRAGGLGFVVPIAKAFAPLAFAVSAVQASRAAHGVLYHDVNAQSLKLEAVVGVLVIVAVCIAPLLSLYKPLRRARFRALREYGALVGEHARLVRRRWILREVVKEDALLAAPEMGAAADTYSLYTAARDMRPFPVGKSSVLGVVVPAAIPWLVVFAIELPLKTILMKLLKGLV